MHRATAKEIKNTAKEQKESVRVRERGKRKNEQKFCCPWPIFL